PFPPRDRPPLAEESSALQESVSLVPPGFAPPPDPAVSFGWYGAAGLAQPAAPSLQGEGETYCPNTTTLHVPVVAFDVVTVSVPPDTEAVIWPGSFVEESNVAIA